MSQGAETIDFANHPLLRALATYDPGQSSYTYRFANAGEDVVSGGYSGGSTLTSAWSAAERAGFVAVTDRYSQVANLSFSETTNTSTRDFNLQIVDDVPGGWAGYAGGSTFVVGSANTSLLTHELGHSLGLDHPFSGTHTLPGVTMNDSADPGDYGWNSEYYTIMAYARGGFTEHPDLMLPAPQSLGVLDIAALQAIYGANSSHNASNTTYGMTTEVTTIWDAGGVDGIDLSANTNDAVIDLRAATLQSAPGGLGYASIIDMGGSGDFGAYTIAYGVTIENGFGGMGDDQITGNAVANTLNGGLGADTIHGGAGNDLIQGTNGAAIDDVALVALNSGALNNSALVANNYAMPGSVTIDMVLQFDPLVTHKQRILSYEPDNSSALGLELQLWDEDFPYLYAIRVTPSAGGGLSYSTLSTGITRAELLDGDIHRLTVSRDASTGVLSFYLDGTLQGSSVDRPGEALPAGGSLVFGQSQGVWGGSYTADHAFEGQMGPIAVYDTALSDSAIAAQSVAHLANPNHPDLISYWTPQPGGSFADATSGQALSANNTGAVIVQALSSDDDILHGEAGNDRMFAGQGDDMLYGGTGGDLLDGGTGRDALYGGNGNDFYVVRSANDTVIEANTFANGGGYDTVRSFVDHTLAANVERGFLGFAGGTNSTDMTGNGLGNRLFGNAGQNSIEGRGGNDIIYARGGNDVITGNLGADQIFAGFGADRIIGGGGSDRIDGGFGADTFVYRNPAESLRGAANRDVITQFQVNLDRFDLSQMDADTLQAGNQAFNFIGSAGFSGTAGELRANPLSNGAAVVVAGDTSGDGIANFQIFINQAGQLDAGDFLL